MLACREILQGMARSNHAPTLSNFVFDIPISLPPRGRPPSGSACMLNTQNTPSLSSCSSWRSSSRPPIPGEIQIERYEVRITAAATVPPARSLPRKSACPQPTPADCAGRNGQSGRRPKILILRSACLETAAIGPTAADDQRQPPPVCAALNRANRPFPSHARACRQDQVAWDHDWSCFAPPYRYRHLSPRH